MNKLVRGCVGLLVMAVLVAWAGDSAWGNTLDYWDKKCARKSESKNPWCLQHRAGKLYFGPDDSKKNLELAEKLLKEALAIDPWQFYSMSNLEKVYSQQKDYNKFLQVTNCMIHMRPWNLELRYYRCLQIEAMGCDKEEAKACFRDVAKRYKARGRFGATYVLASLLAEDPNTEEIKRNYKKLVKPGNRHEDIWNNLIKDFSRDEFVKKMKLVDSEYQKSHNWKDADITDCSAFMPMPANHKEKMEYRTRARQEKLKYYRTIRVQQRRLLVNEYLREKKYQAALDLYEQKPRLGPSLGHDNLVYCVLKEKVGRPKPEVRSCYQLLLKDLEDMGWTDWPTYRTAGILAYWPDRDYIKKHIMSKFQPGSKAQKVWTKYLWVLRIEDIRDPILKR